MPAKKPLDKELVLQNFGARLKALRLKKGLTGDELGEKAGMTKQNINAFESGLRNPTLIAIVKLCKALGVKIDAFFKGFK